MSKLDLVLFFGTFIVLVLFFVCLALLFPVQTRAEKVQAALVECELSGVPKATCEDVIAEREFGSRGCW